MIIKAILFIVFTFYPPPTYLNAAIHIDPTDRAILEQFFDTLIHTSAIGYSLCGNKPISSECFLKFSMLKDRAVSALPAFVFKTFHYSILWTGWECWKKYEPLFPSKNFTFKFDETRSLLVLINNAALKKQIEAHLDTFQSRFPLMSSDEIYQTLLTESDLFELKPYLLGILYGFGKNNSLQFSNRCFLPMSACFYDNELGNIQGYGFRIIEGSSNDQENRQAETLLHSCYNEVSKEFTHTKSHLETFLRLYTK